MVFPRDLLSHNTWSHVGLGLTATVFALGALAIVAPETAGSSLGVIPTTLEGRAVNEKAMVFLGIRDVAVSSALFWFFREGKQKEMGVIMTAWTLVCVTDTWIAKDGPRGWDKGIWTLCAGVMVISLGGLGLVQV